MILPFTEVNEDTAFPEMKYPQRTPDYSNYYEVERQTQSSIPNYDTRRSEENRRTDYYDGSGEVAAASIRGTLRISTF